ncbi:transmembrane protein 79 [Varanus komodoensis]|uniref:Transmembrane protein 79 n=1 Tax=Varanus komodoensis TaxID=61221 RepID=A0A8D2JGR6_VARKO|nr:transmembrane protein 79 [Varanus komodoensis]
MAAAAPSEDLAMVVLGADPRRGAPEPRSEDLETTLPCSQSCCDVTCEAVVTLEASGTDTRPSPEGSREEAAVSSITVHEAFPAAPSTEEEEEEEEEEDEDEGSLMPEPAAHPFVPISPYCIQRPPPGSEKQPQWEYAEMAMRCPAEKGALQAQNLLSRGYLARFEDAPSGDGEQAKACAGRGRRWCRCSCSSASLKALASMISAAIIFPCLLYGAYVFLPFDVPWMPTMGSRLVYTLRCGVFATFPIVIGMVVYGVSRLCFSSLQPFGQLRREVEIHRHYVSQSVHLFILYFFNIAVLSTYLPQEALKLIPLLTALFAISRLLYWLAYAMGRSFRGFGFGLTFLPIVTMLLFNLYSMFLLDAESMFATAGSGEAPAEKEQRAAPFKPRYWG